MKVSVIKIGNSKGIRFSKSIIEQYNITDKVDLVFEDGHFIVKPIKAVRKGWSDAFKEMHANADDELLIPDVFEEESFEE